MSGETPTVREALAVYATEAYETERVPPGYKQTEVGVIPEDWGVDTLESLARIQRGASPRPIDSPIWYDGSSGIGWVRISDVTASDGKQLKATRDYLSSRGVASSRFLPSGSLIMSICATVGIPVITKIDSCIHDGFVGFSDLADVDREFLYYKLKELEPLFRAKGQTGSQSNLNSDIVRFCRVALPPIPEQRAIAAALSNVDALIAALDKLIAKKRAVKTAAMQQLLTGKQRLPGFSGEWKMRRLGEFCMIVSGGTPSTSVPAFWTGEIPWCTPTDITEDASKYLYKTHRTISEDGLKHSSAVLLPRGALLLCTRATVGEIKIAAMPVSTNQGFKSLLCGRDVSNEFVFYKLVMLKGRLRELGVGSTFLEVSRKDVAALQISLPDLEEQTAIAAVLSDMDAEIEALETRQKKTRKVKQGMMQELLTGRVRLPHDAANEEERTQAPKQVQPEKSGHNWAFNEAVVISVLAKKFATARYPLGRMRYTKLAYLMHRRAEGTTEGYLKKAAGPYNPATRYKGPEAIAEKNGYVSSIHSGRFTGLVSGQNIDQAFTYFRNWYGDEVLEWLERFRYERNDTLELLTTVDMAVQELREAGGEIAVDSVEDVLRGHEEWRPKLKKQVFSKANIGRAINRSRELFGGSENA